MIGILFFWFAFLPLQLVPIQHFPSSQEHVQPEKKPPVALQKGMAGNAAVKKIRDHFSPRHQQKSAKSGIEKGELSNRFVHLYAVRGFRPLWTKPSMVAQLVTAIEESIDDGLDPSDYHLSEIKGFYNQPPATPEQEARYDLLLSDALYTLASHLAYGKVDPQSLDPDWNIKHVRSRSTFEQMLQHAIESEQIALVLQELRPQNPEYAQLRKWLARYRVIAREGGWPVVEEGPMLQKGAQDKRVPALRQRLKASGDIEAMSDDTSKVYSGELADAIKRFQKRNGMDTDGVVGAATLHAMNISVERRIAQIRINLERYRWFVNALEPTYVMVNSADFHLHYVENGRNRWETRVIVGQPSRETPVFRATMQGITFNPKWVIPPTILAKDALPALRKSASYLRHKKLKVLDLNGNVVNPESVQWSQYSAADFPYHLQQSAGDDGALGRIKFLLPNKHIVYLHDTPNKELFEKTTRAFSSGCIRVENPVDLAELVLQDRSRWSRPKLLEAINTGQTRTVSLKKPIPVYILYLTAEPKGDDLLFRDDVYHRDDKVLKALNKPVLPYKKES